MHRFRWLSFSLIFLFSCGKSLPEIEGFDREAFAVDKNACNGNRTKMMAILEKNKNELLALSQMDIVKVLGRPDQNELYKRNQKFFYYFITPAPQCGTPSDSVSRRLIIRFNAMGLAKEIYLE